MNSNPLTCKTARKRLYFNNFKERLVHFNGTVMIGIYKIKKKSDRLLIYSVHPALVKVDNPLVQAEELTTQYSVNLNSGLCLYLIEGPLCIHYDKVSGIFLTFKNEFHLYCGIVLSVSIQSEQFLLTRGLCMISEKVIYLLIQQVFV